MGKSKMTRKEVRAVVDNEGLGYAVQHYMTGKYIRDATLALAWDLAKEALDLVERLLEEK